jgi:hypothetical protein
MKLVRSALLAAAACMASPVLAQQALEVIPLQHRTADQVLPSLRPLLEPGATLTGHNNQLIVRASAANIAELRSVLDVIDRPARRLQISVRFDNAAHQTRQGVEWDGRAGGDGARLEMRAQDASRDARQRLDQRLQVLEGGRAFISTGQSRTLPQRQIIQTPAGVVSQQTMVVQEISTGFEVVPRVAGSMVTLDIAPQREVPGPAGTVQSQRLATLVSARLGEWVDIGSAVESSMRDERALGSGSRAARTDARAIWVKVEELIN